MHRLIIGALLLSLAACTGVAEEKMADGQSVKAMLTKAAVGSHRSDDNIARNDWRHPVETLMFFGIKPDMTVVEISPGGSGWYTEVLAPFLRADGNYVAGSYDPDATSDYAKRNTARYAEKLAAHPEVYDRITLGVFAPPNLTDTVPAGSADMVLTFRNTHNWMGNDVAGSAYKAFYKMLKPGGVLGVVQHRAPAGSEIIPERGYLPQAKVIELAEAAGFRLAASSEINANPRDTADHPEGVWTLPPSFRLGDVDRAKYQAIGESDRMTLKFIKK